MNAINVGISVTLRNFVYALAALTLITGSVQAASRYALILSDAPATAKFASQDEIRSTAGVAYRRQLESVHRSLESDLTSRRIRVTGSVTTLLNAVFVEAPKER